MKADNTVAALIGLISTVTYAVFLQHIFSEMYGHPELSWINTVKTRWVTRQSRRYEKKLKVFDFKKTVEEPTVD